VQTPTIVELIESAAKSAYHLEMRDAYDLRNPAFSTWSASGLLPAVDEREPWAAWRDLVARTVSRGVQVRRARVVSEPVTDYIRWEHEVTTVLNAPAGEKVRWLPRRRASHVALPGNDFWLLDGKTVLFGHFAGDGRVIDHELVDDSDVVGLCVAAFAAVWERGVPHAVYRPA
jgi:hypothetical protein